jgi:arabinogalactan endo-1,4-beta-galactosidase
MQLKHLFTAAALTLSSLTACSENDRPEPNPPTEESTFAKGADVSWVTEMEKAGVKFYNSRGTETECMALMKQLGMNSIRLRVWVNPANGWCNKSDLLVKAIRAKNLGMRVMVDSITATFGPTPRTKPSPPRGAACRLPTLRPPWPTTPTRCSRF